MADVLAQLRQRGIGIGSQTQDRLDKLAAKLEGRRAEDRCGGL